MTVLHSRCLGSKVNAGHSRNRRGDLIGVGEGVCVGDERLLEHLNACRILSAFCGAVSAGAAAGAAISYLDGGDLDDVSHTLVNALAIASGIVCDGAKASCAAKISSSIDAAQLGHQMYRDGQQFYGGDGLVLKGVENTIRSICEVGREGMKDTDRKIIELMTQC